MWGLGRLWWREPVSPSGARLEVVPGYGACGRGGAVGGDRLCAERVVMIFPSNRVRIMVATKPVDFRKGHDGLVAYVQSAPVHGHGVRVPGEAASEAGLLGWAWSTSA